jgi:hypothetical protein
MRRARTTISNVTVGILAAGALTAGETPEAASASSARSKACDSRDSRTLPSSTRKVRIFKKDGMTFGCHIDRGRKYSFGDDADGDGGVTFVRVAGSVVAYQLRFTGRSNSKSFVRARDLRTGQRLREASRGPIYAQEPPWEGLKGYV